MITILPGRIDPPFWWKPWLSLYPLLERWRTRKVSPRKYAKMARKGRV